MESPSNNDLIDGESLEEGHVQQPSKQLMHDDGFFIDTHPVPLPASHTPIAETEPSANPSLDTPPNQYTIKLSGFDRKTVPPQSRLFIGNLQSENTNETEVANMFVKVRHTSLNFN